MRSVVDLFNVDVYWFSVGLLLGFSLRYCVLLVWAWVAGELCGVFDVVVMV